MTKDKPSVSEEMKGKSYKQMGEFLDTCSAADYWDQTQAVDEEIEVDPVSGEEYYRIEPELSSRLRALAKQHGMSPGKLLNSWLEEKLKDIEL